MEEALWWVDQLEVEWAPVLDKHTQTHTMDKHDRVINHDGSDKWHNHWTSRPQTHTHNKLTQ